MIILASRSPQRRSLLTALGVPFRIVTSGYDEPDLPHLGPPELVREHAVQKARDVARRTGVPPGGGVLGCDTTVVIDGETLGKPASREAAADMLQRLSGRRHVVISGLCLIAETGESTVIDETTVTFREITTSHRDWYLDRREWQGRAGGYAIQGSGASLVSGVNGDFTTVVGLPIGALVALLGGAGLAPWSASAAS